MHSSQSPQTGQRHNYRLYKNHQVCLSTGNEQLDGIIHGYVVGSIVTIITTDDFPSEYNLQLLRLSAADAVVNKQHVVLYDGYSQKGKKFWENLLPKVTKKVYKKKQEDYKQVESKNLKYGDVLKNQSEGASDNLLLAWRYNECIQTQADLKNKQQDGIHFVGDFKDKICDYQFDLSHSMTNLIAGHNIPIEKEKYFNTVDTEFATLNELWDSICNEYQERLESADDSSLFRFFIPNFLDTSFFSQDPAYSNKEVVKFFRNLRALVPTMQCVFTLTVSADSLSPALMNHLIKQSDLVLDLKSFTDSEDSFLEYQGSLRLLKQPTVNGMVGHKADQDMYVFKMKSDRKTFIVDTVHMDPEGEKINEKDDGEANKGTPNVVCSSNPAKKDPLDF